MKLSKNIDDKTIAKKLLINALKMEESLADLIRIEVKILRKKVNEQNSYDEIRKINKIVKYTIFSMTLIDDKIQKALELYKINSTDSNDKT